MTNKELIERMKELLNEPNYYGSGGNNWSSYINDGWYVDCICSIKAILWGGRFTEENRGKAHAGCNYGSNGVPDFTSSSCVDWIGATKGNFELLVPGEILLMPSHNHGGIYIGNGEVIEITPAWTGGRPGCQISKIGSNGERFKNGIQVYSWEYHGKIPTIEYVSEEPVVDNPFPGVSDEELARRVWLGEFGNGDERKAKLGIRYNAVQALVEQGIGKPEPKPTPTPTPVPTPIPVVETFNAGDKIFLNTSATTYQGASKGIRIPDSRKGQWYHVQQVNNNLRTLLLKELYSWVLMDECTKKGTSDTSFAVGDRVVPTRLVNYNGTRLTQYDPVYTITELTGNRAVLSARGSIWAAMNTNDIKKA